MRHSARLNLLAGESRGQKMLQRLSLAIVAVLLICAVFAPWLAPHDPLAVSPGNHFIGPFQTWENPLGTDVVGRDILSRLIYGARISLTVVLGSACISAAGGSVLGLVAGYRGGWIDRALVRLTGLPTAISSIRSPWGFALIGVIWFPLVFSILVSFLKPGCVRTLLSLIFWPVGFHIKFFAGLSLVATFGPGLFNIVLALAIRGVLGVALMVRNSILATRSIRREAPVGVDVEAAASLAN